MNGYRANLPAKIFGVGLIGVLASMGLLLHTLKMVGIDDDPTRRSVISQSAFQELMRNGEVVECTLEDGRLSGLRLGRGHNHKPFRVEGEIPRKLVHAIMLWQIPLKKVPPQKIAPPRVPPQKTSPKKTSPEKTPPPVPSTPALGKK